MRKRSKILAIALLTIATACCCALSSIFAFANTVPNSNLTTWGDAEAGDSQGLTAVTTEKFEGEKSFEFSGTKKIRIIQTTEEQPLLLLKNGRIIRLL